MPDILAVLIVILIVALVLRGPRTLPQIGAMLGRGVRDARRETGKTRSESSSDTGDPTKKP